MVSRRTLDGVIALITPTAWERPTPCEGWSVYDVANHVVGGAVRYRMLLDGAVAADLERSRGDDFLQPDAVHAARAAGDALFEAAGGELDRVVHHRHGDCSAEDLLVMRVFEQTLHAWDLAEGLGVEVRLEPRLCRFLLGRLDVIKAGQEHGVYAGAVDAGGDSDCVRLLAAAGRG